MLLGLKLAMVVITQVVISNAESTLSTTSNLRDLFTNHNSLVVTQQRSRGLVTQHRNNNDLVILQQHRVPLTRVDIGVGTLFNKVAILHTSQLKASQCTDNSHTNRFSLAPSQPRLCTYHRSMLETSHRLLAYSVRDCRVRHSRCTIHGTLTLGQEESYPPSHST